MLKSEVYERVANVISEHNLRSLTENQASLLKQGYQNYVQKKIWKKSLMMTSSVLLIMQNPASFS